MRTLSAVSPQKRRRVARETMEIYAPIANRLGLNGLFHELQELAFANINPLRYDVLLRATRAARAADGRPDRDWNLPLDYRLLEGEHDLFGDGALVILPTPGHTAGHQSLRIESGSGLRLCLTGDACYTQEHMERDLLPAKAAVWHEGRMRESLGALRRMRERDGTELIYGHDGAQLRDLRRCPEPFA